MFGWIIIIAATVAMYRMAEMSDRSGALWAALTFVICFACAAFIPLPLINLGIGLVLSYGALILISVFGK